MQAVPSESEWNGCDRQLDRPCGRNSELRWRRWQHPGPQPAQKDISVSRDT